MSRRRRAALTATCAVATLLANCSSDVAEPQRSAATPTTDRLPASTTVVTAATSTIATTPGEPVRLAIDIGGGQAYGLAAGTDSIWAISYDAGTLVRIDPTTNAVTDSISIGPSAASVLAEGDTLWVAGYGPGAIYRVDPTTATKTATIGVGEACCDLAFGNGMLWVTDPRGFVKAIDPATNAVAAQFAVPVDRNAHTNAVFAGGAVWVSSDTTHLYRVDPATGTTTDFDIGGGVPFIARDGLVWGASPTAVWAIDAVTGEVVHHIDLVRSIEVLSLDIGTSAVWVGVRHPGRVGAVQHIDIASGTVLEEFDVDIPARIVLAFDSVWVTESGGSEVVRFGPITQS